MPDYIYTREKIDSGDFMDCWDINNPAHQDPSGVPIRLAREIKDAFPGWDFNLRCSEAECVISAPVASSDVPALDLIVATHKADRSGSAIKQCLIRGQYAMVPSVVVVPGVLGVLGGVALDIDSLVDLGNFQLYQVRFEGWAADDGATVSLWQDDVQLGSPEPITSGSSSFVTFDRTVDLSGEHTFSLKAELGAATSAEVRFAVLTVFELVPELG